MEILAWGFFIPQILLVHITSGVHDWFLGGKESCALESEVLHLSYRLCGSLPALCELKSMVSTCLPSTPGAHCLESTIKTLCWNIYGIWEEQLIKFVVLSLLLTFFLSKGPLRTDWKMTS
jgi:hypothetical protein